MKILFNTPLKSLAILFLTGLSLASCGGGDESVSIAPVYKIIAEKSSAEALADLDSLPGIKEAYFGFLGIGNPTPEVVESIAASSVIKIFTPDVDSVWPSLTPLEQSLGHILAKAEKDSLAFPQREYGAVVWAATQPMVMTDKALLIALNLYLGENYEGYEGWPEYIRKTLNKERLPYDLCRALIVGSYAYQQPESKENATMSRMLFEGAVTYVVAELVKDSSLAQNIGWSEDQLGWAKRKEKEIWKEMVNQSMLYNASPEVEHFLFDFAPSSTLFGMETPPRIGRMIGYNIVKSYCGNQKDVTLPFLLSPKFYNSPESFALSGYNPR